MRKTSKTVMMMAGGTGGHIFPALAIAEELRRRQYQVVWLGSKKGMEEQLVPRHQFPLELVSMKGARGKGLLGAATTVLRLLLAIGQAIWIFRKIRPDLTIGMGGFVTVPGGVVSFLFRCPLLIHEQNAISGMSNNLLLRLCRQCFCAFPNAFPTRIGTACEVVGNPVREEILQLAQKRQTIHDDKVANQLRVLILGGSRGAQAINTLMPEVFARLRQANPEMSYQVRHQCGQDKLQQVEESLQQWGLDEQYEVLAFIEDMAVAYAWADLLICRAGALTVSEIAIAAKASILIPYPYAVDDHQTANARYLSESGAAILIQERDLSVAKMIGIIEKCSFSKIRQMSQRAATLAQPQATTRLVNAAIKWMQE